MQNLKLSRRALLISSAALFMRPLRAQTFPSRPIRIIVGFGPGGTTDVIARSYGQLMSEQLNVSVIVDNKPGGNQINAIRTLLNSPPDGYTLYAATGSSLVQNPAIKKDLIYDPLKDFSYIGLAAKNPGVIFCNQKLPVNTLNDLVTYAAANPGQLNYASAGVGTSGHFAGEAFLHATGVKITHIPYKADAEVIREVMGGAIDMSIMTTLNTTQAIKSGKIKALAVCTASRLPYLPDVPTLRESGFNNLDVLDPYTFISLVGPAGISAATQNQLNAAMNKAATSVAFAAKIRDTLYTEPMRSSPASFREFTEKQISVWQKLAKSMTLPV
ncbi:Bug family tripartite tricarboxylate transporter substrate binding protein [Advenella mimigardefordensis]|uniref:Putative Bug-like extracytoplasmic solute binding receptor, TTT family n=1 Tax=Advenella mimigardefordensis (strain DSM 17166 / LMG 22922 / DPN7) TaxID=1247726 RepID=W0PBJ9_ADVMD|nr:tripartite tricarboxylate transporter substrate binding protein [Advenella mimigardefordensis]AHG64121.1 putative Bug-like extracytoplasmic solute binding receptor, TTT family [Advenella mimigardefordensis DPN7]